MRVNINTISFVCKNVIPFRNDFHISIYSVYRFVMQRSAPHDVSKLNKDSMRQDFLTDICNQLDAMNLSSEDPEENWTVFHKTVLSSAASTFTVYIRAYAEQTVTERTDVYRSTRFFAPKCFSVLLK